VRFQNYHSKIQYTIPNNGILLFHNVPATSIPAPVKAPVKAPVPLAPPTDGFEPTIAPSEVGIAPAAPPVIPPTAVTPTIAPSICDMYDFGGVSEGAGCSPNILDTAREMSELSLAVILFERAGLTDIFDCAGPFTVQLPTNDAVENVDAALLDFLLRPENQAELMNLMLYHILPGSFPTADLVPGPTPTLASGAAEVVISLNPTMFNNATVLMADITACNGLINTIDSVLTFLPISKYCNAKGSFTFVVSEFFSTYFLFVINSSDCKSYRRTQRNK
jgi:hypothetical protein